MARPDRPNHGENPVAYAARVLHEIKKEGKPRQDQINELMLHVFQTDPRSTVVGIRKMLAVEGEWRDRNEMRIAVKYAIKNRNR